MKLNENRHIPSSAKCGMIPFMWGSVTRKHQMAVVVCVFVFYDLTYLLPELGHTVA